MESGKKEKYKNILFSDLDGTLITPIFGKDFPIACYDMMIKWNVLEAIRTYAPEVVIIVSNQGGIEAGFVNANFFHNKITWVASVIAEFCKCDCMFEYCSTNDRNDILRKPNPGMINKFIKEFDNDFKAAMIGDRDEDCKCAENANIQYFNVNEFVGKFGNTKVI